MIQILLNGKQWWDRITTSWWRDQMETFSALLALCVGNSLVTGEFPIQRRVTRSFDDCFDMCLKKRFSKQSRRPWLETPLHSLWRHCNACTRHDRLAVVTFANLWFDRTIGITNDHEKNIWRNENFYKTFNFEFFNHSWTCFSHHNRSMVEFMSSRYFVIGISNYISVWVNVL